MEEPFFQTPHAAEDCEDCHGAGGEHLAAGGDMSLSFREKAPEVSTAQCLDCHQSMPEISAFAHSAHGRGNLSCVSCHQVHPQETNFGLLKAERTDLCVGCHQATRAEFQKPYHHPVLEGAMDCVDCHSPHLEERRPLRRLALGADEGCLDCHSDKKGPFAFEHLPLKVNGCQSCHQPHGSVNARLLDRAQVAQLCLECHTMTPGVAGSQPPAFHDLRSSRFRSCTTCHREIHGSNSSPLFMR
ncbi:MAG: DmsE family decaheme c-type cytochrome [Acidobacteriota bacterium]